MRKKILYLFVLFFLIISTSKAQTVNGDIQQVEHGGMIVDVPSKWDCQSFPVMGDNSFGFYAANEDSVMILFAVSTHQEIIDDILDDMLTDQNRVGAKSRNISFSKTPQSGVFNGMQSNEYLIEGKNSEKDYQGKLILLNSGEHKYIISYYGFGSTIKGTEFKNVLASFVYDENWTIEDEYEEITEFSQTNDGYLIYDEEDVSFEFPSQWTIQECSYSPESQAYAFACEKSDSLTFFFMMSKNEVMQEEYINNLPQYEEESSVKYLAKKPSNGSFAGMKTKEYEFEIPSLSDLSALKGRVMFFNNNTHYFYILYGDKVSYKKNKDFKRLLNSFKTK